MGLFSKKKGGSFFGNLLATVANKATGGLLGAKRVAALKSGDLASINPDAKTTGKMLAGAQADGLINTTFAGQPAQFDPNSSTYEMSTPLKEVEVKSGVNPNGNVVDALLKTVGDKLSYLGARTSENTKFGIDDGTKWLIGLGIGAIALVLATKK